MSEHWVIQRLLSLTLAVTKVGAAAAAAAAAECKHVQPGAQTSMYRILEFVCDCYFSPVAIIFQMEKKSSHKIVL